MPELLKDLLSSEGLMPHGHCDLWRPGLTWLHAASDALTAATYAAILFALQRAVLGRDLPLPSLLRWFGGFLIACVATHGLEIGALADPAALAGIVQAAAAIASVPLAVVLIRMLRSALSGSLRVQTANPQDDLRRAHEALELRVQERTAELARKNAELAAEVAERTRIQEALTRSQRKFQRLADAGIIGVITADLTGAIREANDAFLAMVGYSRDEMRAGLVRWDTMTPPEYRANGAQAVQRIGATGVAPAWETECIRRDGSRVPALVGIAAVDAAAGEHIGFVLDLTERKRAADEIRRLEQQREADARVRALLEAAPDAMVITDERGRIVLVNAETEQLFGYDRTDLLGRSVDLLVPEPLRAVHAAHRAQFSVSPGERRTMGAGRQLAGLRQDGSEFPADITASAVQTTAGILVSTAIRDVTERKRAEEALQRAVDAAEAAHAELETFSYSVAHDLRAPLRGMSGYSTALLEDHADKLDAEAREYLTRIIAGSQRMGEIIDALLKLARLARTEPRREPVDLGQLGRAVIEQLRAGDPGRAVEFIADDGLVVHGDPGLLRVLLDNLLGNAWKFTGKRAGARIELGRAGTEGGVPAYFVRDNGAGFDPRLVDKLFVPFRRLHAPSEFEGTGIGLATVRRIIRNHGGRVWAEGAESRGATFCFTLPSPPPRSRPPSRSPFP